MTVSTSKTNYPKVRLLKTLRHSFVKILQLSQKRLNHDAFLTGTTKELSTMPKTFVYTAITVKKQMPVEKSCSAVLNVHPVQPATKPAPISLKNSVTVLIRLLTFVMDARKLSIVVPLHTSTATMPSLQNASTRNVCLHPELDMSVRTLYSYLNDGVLTARNVDLKRKVKFKPRKVHKTQIKDRTVFQGRMFTDFQKLKLDHFAEMDTVHSSQESKRVILTFFLTREKLFLAFIMNRCTKGAVRLIFDKLEHQLGTYDFLTLFNTILTDRGSEFGDPDSLETGCEGMIRSSIYFCDPMRSGQKGGIEQAHTMLRMVLPKKTSFEFLTQWDLRTIVDHINSTPRESLGGRTPYDVALEHYGIDILKALQLRPIPPDEVNLTPKLIRFNH